jgi:CII-binding regulator of phage lambda lysogenization HflD
LEGLEAIFPHNGDFGHFFVLAAISRKMRLTREIASNGSNSSAISLAKGRISMSQATETKTTSAAEAFGELAEQIHELRFDVQQMDEEFGELKRAVREMAASFEYLERQLKAKAGTHG